MTVDEKRKLELKTMYQIIGIYCHNKHHTPKGQLCEECQKVWQYAEHRIDVCPHMESKTFCSVCKTHCYAPTYREKIREIMRYGGPRMLFVSPIQVVRHMYLLFILHLYILPLDSYQPLYLAFFMGLWQQV